MDNRPYYYRVRGRLFGPIPLRQIQQLAQRAQLVRSTDVSRDGIQWAKASDFPEIFAAKAVPPPPTGSLTRSAPGHASGGEVGGIQPSHGPGGRWYYTVSGSQQGPVDLATLQQLVATGSVSAQEYVLREGDAAWISATQLPTSSGMPLVDVTSGGGGRLRQRGEASKGGAGMAVASMVLGLFGLIAWLLPIIGLPTTITGVTLGVMSRRHGMGIAGICLASLGLVLSVVNASVGAYLGTKGRTFGWTTTSPSDSFSRFVAQEMKESPQEGFDRSTESIEVFETNNLTNPYSGRHEFIVREPPEALDEVGIELKRDVHWEFVYKGDGHNWTLDECYMTVVAIDILKDPLHVGDAIKKQIGVRRKVK